MPEQLVKADPEIAAALFATDLAAAFESPYASQHGWRRIDVDPLTAVVEMAVVKGTAADNYFLKLQGDWYNNRPPRVTFVAPDFARAWPEVGDGSRWLPRLNNANPGIAIHPAYDFGDAHRQLICSSINADYYPTHEPQAGKIWVPGSMTLMWTLVVIQDELDSVNYQGPFGADYS